MAGMQNIDRFRRRIAAVPVQARKRIREALVRGAKEINGAQRALAARSRRSGELIAGIGYRDGEHDLQLEIFSEAFYSRYVEFGTSQAQAQPFFFAGYRLMRKKAKDRVRRATKTAAKEAARVG